MIPAEEHSPKLSLTRPGIIEASAGTGKTFTIAEIYLALLRGDKVLHGTDEIEPTDEKHFAPRVREILVVTFTEAATAELRARLRKRIRDALSETITDSKILTSLRLADAEFDEAAVFTIHGFCLRILKEFGISPRTGEIRASLSDELSRFAARWRTRKIAEGDSIFFSIEVPEICNVLFPLLQNPDLVPARPKAEDARGNAFYRVATEAFLEWKTFREQASDISYGEILITLRDALLQDPKLSAKIASRFRVAVVDEFQDTDPIQWDIFRKIFLTNGNPIFCVGDPKQAIYEFRGGDIRTYRKARGEILATSGGNALALYENWRSKPETIAAFNEIFAFDNAIPGTLNLGTEKKPREIAVELSGLLDYRPVAFPQAKIGHEVRGKGNEASETPAGILKITPPESSKERAGEIVRTHITHDIVDLIRTRGVSASDIAILVSDNDEANSYRSALAREQIPVSTTARGNVLCEPVAGAISDILHAMLEPRSTPLFRRALLTPFLTGKTNWILSENENSDEIENFRRAFADAHARWEKHGILSAFRMLSDTLGFSQNLANQKFTTELATHVSHLTEILHATEQKSALTPRSLVTVFDTMLANANPRDESEELQLRATSDEDAVRILTVHKSKGLEFEIVFIPSLWSKNLYSSRSSNVFAKGTNDAGDTVLIFDTEKEKSASFLRAAIETAGANAACLFYVALTRARSRIVLYHVPQIAKRELWNSYQKQLLAVAISKHEENPNALKHWEILPAESKLPYTAFPENPPKRTDTKTDTLHILSPEEAEIRFSLADTVKQSIAKATEGVFSFSKIIHATETESGSHLRDDDETISPPQKSDAAEFSSPRQSTTSFPQKKFSDLPVGAEFGTLAHFVFEKTNFRTRENLEILASSALSHYPNWQTFSPAEQNTLREKLISMVEENLTLPLFPKNEFRLEMLGNNDTVSEMEFHFPLKRSRNLYADLFRIFKSWGGIYAETADYHWSQNAIAGESPLNIAGMMTGIIDLVFRANGKFFILDWKTNIVSAINTPDNFYLNESAIREEIVRHGYALQWTIYALALRKFLKTSLGKNYNHQRDFGGVIYLFVRWCAPFIDTGTLTDTRLDELEKKLADESVR